MTIDRECMYTDSGRKRKHRKATMNDRAGADFSAGDEEATVEMEEYTRKLAAVQGELKDLLD
ncbi:hypothetical protein PInf_018492 [Phytophthora infestans]|nr:hypothetical protein PInf_018492 [Phytophthora infestans]